MLDCRVGRAKRMKASLVTVHRKSNETKRSRYPPSPFLPQALCLNYFLKCLTHS